MEFQLFYERLCGERAGNGEQRIFKMYGIPSVLYAFLRAAGNGFSNMMEYLRFYAHFCGERAGNGWQRILKINGIPMVLYAFLRGTSGERLATDFQHVWNSSGFICISVGNEWGTASTGF